MLMDVDFDDDTPNRCTTLVYYAWKIFTCLFTHVLLVTMVVLYCLLGAFAFERLESANEIEVSQFKKKNDDNNILFTRIYVVHIYYIIIYYYNYYSEFMTLTYHDCIDDKQIYFIIIFVY